MSSRVPLPQQGQPLDVEYLYTLASAINSLADSTSMAVDRTTSVKTRGASAQVYTVRTGDAKIVAGYTTVLGGGTSVTQGQTIQWSYKFPQSFGIVPVVTATAVNTGRSGSNVDPSVVITAISRDSVTGSVIFRNAGTWSLDINVIAVGTAPNSGTF
jgi:hypothetical protein